MTAAPLTQWHYALVQFVPDRERAEGVNVGLVMSQDFGSGLYLERLDVMHLDRLEARLDVVVDTARLERALKAIFVRIERNAPRGAAELLRFFNAEGGTLAGTRPRSMRVEDPPAEGRSLFEKLILPHRGSWSPREMVFKP